jgi:putative PEP-CTERM system TPR-repeat lipoprotein
MAQRASLLAVSGLSLALILTACNKQTETATLVADAQHYIDQGQRKAALIQLRNAVAQSPQDVNARLLLARVYNDVRIPVSAEKEARKAQSLGAPAAQVLPVLAKSLLLQGEPQKAIDEMAAVTEHAPALDVLRGEAWLVLGQPDKAREAFDNVLKAEPSQPDALIGMARYSLTQDDQEGAARYADLATDKNPRSVEVWLFKGELARAKDENEAALKAYDTALQIDPGNVNAQVLKAHVQITAKQYDAARATLAAAAKATPNAVEVLHAQARLELAEEHPQKALELLQQALKLAPQHMPSLLLAGTVHYRMGNMVQAGQQLSAYLEFDRHHVFARKLLALSYLRQDQPDKALEALTPAINESVPDAELYALAGESAMRQHDFSKATEYMQRASTLAPKMAALRNSLGISELLQGKSQAGMAELEAASAMDNYSSRNGALLVMAHMQAQELDKALVAVKRLVQNQPNDAFIKNLEGSVYLKRGDQAAARAAFEKAVSLQPSYYQPVSNLALLDLQGRKPDAARQRYLDFLAANPHSITTQLALANLEMLQGRREEALRWLEKASAERPEEVSTQVLLAGQYLQNGAPDKALQLASKLQVSQPSNRDVLDLVAQIKVAKGDYPGALENYAQLAAIQPKSGLAKLRLAQMYMATGNITAAESNLRAALALQPNLVEANLAQATLDLKRKDYDSALEVARRLQHQHANQMMGYALEGDVLQAQDKPLLAARSYEQAYAVGKTSPLLVKLYMTLLQAGKEKEATERLALLSRYPEKEVLQSRMFMGQAFLAMNKGKLALSHFAAAAQLAPNNADAQLGMALAAQLERDPQALGYASQAVKLAATNPLALDTYGWMLVEQGKLGEGLPLLQQAVQLAPKQGQMRYHLALGLIKSGDKKAAKTHLETLAQDSQSALAVQARDMLRTL